MKCMKSAGKVPDIKLVWILGFTGFISAADNWIVSPILPAIASGFSISVAQVGTILTAYLIPYGLMQPVYGFLSDRLGKARVLQWIICGLAAGTIGCAITPSLWILCFWRMVTGFFAAGVIAVSLAFISWQAWAKNWSSKDSHSRCFPFINHSIALSVFSLLDSRVAGHN